MKVVILVSGGPDSLACVLEAQERGHAVHGLFVDYGQPAQSVEQWHAQYHSELFDFPLACVSLRIWLDGMADAVGIGGPRIVPARNAILLSLAANHAAKVGASEIWYGACSADTQYPDCQQAFMDAISVALGMPVRAPMAGVPKREILDRVRYIETTSCYTPIGQKACGMCSSCRTRNDALGISLPR
jgi:7-cyano-7-deazaguanine synthase